MNNTLTIRVNLSEEGKKPYKKWSESEWERLVTRLQDDQVYPGSLSGITFLIDGVGHKQIAFVKNVLSDAPFQVMFGVELGRVGRTEDVSWKTIADLANAGHDFAAKGILNNRFLPQERTQLQVELEVSKRILMKKTGKEIRHFFLETRYVSRQLIGLAYNAGYKGVFSTRNGINPPGTNTFVLRSLNPMEYASANDFLESVKKMMELNASSNMKNWIEGKVRNQFDIGLMNRASALLLKLTETNY